jgi:hypothetical protein
MGEVGDACGTILALVKLPETQWGVVTESSISGLHGKSEALVE